MAPNTSQRIPFVRIPAGPANPTTSPARSEKIEWRHRATRRRSIRAAVRIGSLVTALNDGLSRAFLRLQFPTRAPTSRKSSCSRRQFAGRPGASTKRPVAQNGYPIGDLIYLVDEVGDEDDRQAARLEIANNLEQPAVSPASRLAVGSSSTSTRVSSSSAREIATSCWIATTEYEPSGRSTSISMPSRRSVARARMRAPRHEISPNRRGCRPSVRAPGHRHCRDEIDLLIDGADPERARSRGRADLELPAVEK